MSLLLVIFLLELVVQLVNTIGAKTINNLVRTWALEPRISCCVRALN